MSEAKNGADVIVAVRGEKDTAEASAFLDYTTSSKFSGSRDSDTTAYAGGTLTKAGAKEETLDLESIAVQGGSDAAKVLSDAYENNTYVWVHYQDIVANDEATKAAETAGTINKAPEAPAEGETAPAATPHEQVYDYTLYKAKVTDLEIENSADDYVKLTYSLASSAKKAGKAILDDDYVAELKAKVEAGFEIFAINEKNPNVA